MTNESSHAPAWLFAFVDLAFLMLLGMTQLEGSALDLGELVIPRIGGEAAEALPAGSQQALQLRVHPRGSQARGARPFELVADGREGVRLDAPGLRRRLVEIRGESRGRPLLAPHADSRSQDLLDAVALVEDTWPGRRRATVQRLAP